MSSSDEMTLKTPKILIPEVKIQHRLDELAQEINHDYQGQSVTAICILKGSFIFFADMIRKLDLPVTCEFFGVSSYGNRTVSSGEVKVTLDINEPLENRHIILFEDIVDSGLTLSYLQNLFRTRKPASIRTCALLMKPESLKTHVDVDYIGFKLGNEFVVGYGMDYAGKYRNLPFIGYFEHDH